MILYSFAILNTRTSPAYSEFVVARISKGNTDIKSMRNQLRKYTAAISFLFSISRESVF